MRSGTRAVVAILVVIAAVGVFGCSPTGLAGSTDAAAQIPRTADGKPDLSGIWRANNSAYWDLQTHDARPMVGQPGVYKDVPILAAPVVALGSIGWVPADQGVVEGDGEIPYQPWALARKKENLENWLDRDPEINCFLPGVPRAMYLPHNFQIVQGTSKIAIAFEYAGAHRTIHMDTADPYPVEAYMGASTGKWEGDTLVVNASSFTSHTWFDRSGNFHSDALKVVERYTPIDRNAFRYEAQIEDPKVFTRPWKISMPIYRRLDTNAQMIEFKCVEMAEETLYGHLRREPTLVKPWEGRTMKVEVTRKIPPGEAAHELHLSGNPPE